MNYLDQLNRFLFKQAQKKPEQLRIWLYASWACFGICAVLVTGFTFATIFLSPEAERVWGFWSIVAPIFILWRSALLLADLHAVFGQQSQNLKQIDFHFEWALRLSPNNATLYCQWGLKLLEQNLWERSRYLFESARDMQPADDLPYSSLARWELKQGNWQNASRYFDLGYRLRRGVAWNDLPERIPTETPAPAVIQPIETSISKLQHDIQQLEYLLTGQYVPERFRPLLSGLQEVLRQTLGAGQTQRVKLNKEQQSKIYLVYGRNMFISPVPAFPKEVLNPQLEPTQIEQTYQQANPALVILDDFLMPDACEALLHFCQKSSIWHDDQRPGGYLGSYMDDGFSCDLLYQIAHELRDALPGIFKNMPLKHMWAYKYDAQNQGIGIHADSASINVNFWISPNQGNLDPEHGGLLIYPKAAPADWNFADYNTNDAKAWDYIGQAQPVCVPFKQNRAVIFDSRLFHATDHLNFKSDYLLRRINVTFLYGDP